jgi:hypothetical protein
MKIFKKKVKSEAPNYVSDTAAASTLTYGIENGTLEDKRDKVSYKWRLIAQEIHDIVNKTK